jgi:hypothetical protein
LRDDREASVLDRIGNILFEYIAVKTYEWDHVHSDNTISSNTSI